MRVGVLSLYFRTYNYGAQLQAYALQKAIEKLGHDCELIRFMWCREQTVEGYKNVSIDQNAFIDFSNSIPHSKKVYDADTIRDCTGDYDAFVVGSDQVWGAENSMPLIKRPVMTLSFAGDDKIKLAYAASLGCNRTSSKIEEVLRSGLRNFDFISLREESAIDYVSELAGKQIMHVLDPVFLITKEEWSSASVVCDGKPYIFYYTAGGDEKQKNIVDAIKHKLKLPVRQLGYIKGEKIGPIEFISMIRHAEYVVTDSFHGTAFSIIFNKPFVSLPVDNVPTDKSRNIRIFNLLSHFSLLDRFVEYKGGIESITDHICNKLDEKINWTAVNRLIHEGKKTSVGYLKTALKTEKEHDKYLESKSGCTGCGACLSVCPAGAISMKRDRFGFNYPYRNKDKCIDCGSCDDACNFSNESKPLMDLMGLQSKDNSIRIHSGAGGVFSELATRIIDEGGVVAACRFDSDYSVVHDFCESIGDLDEFRRSKYVQSDAYLLFPKIKEYLGKGVRLLFVGTPCQSAALVAFLREIPEKLYIVDLICGGVTAPGLWDKYKQLLYTYKKPTSVSMRYKHTEYLRPDGFPASSMKISYCDETYVKEDDEDFFLKTKQSFYRESCYNCKYKNNRVSDITIGDFVGMQKSMAISYDGIGTTLSIVRTPKGMELINECRDKLDIVSIQNELKPKVLDDNNDLFSSVMMKPQSYYLQMLYENSSIERIFYEDKRWDEYNAGQAYLKKLFREAKLNELLIKAERFRRYQLLIEDSPYICGEIYIYGAGKLGRSLSRCSQRVVGFIDGNASISSCAGLPAYNPKSEALREKLTKDTTVIVTPVWDLDLIKDDLSSMYPDINIVSAADILESIRL